MQRLVFLIFDIISEMPRHRDAVQDVRDCQDGLRPVLAEPSWIRAGG